MVEDKGQMDKEGNTTEERRSLKDLTDSLRLLTDSHEKENTPEQPLRNQLCEYYAAGFCQWGSKCRFAHGEIAIGTVVPESPPNSAGEFGSEVQEQPDGPLNPDDSLALTSDPSPSNQTGQHDGVSARRSRQAGNRRGVLTGSKKTTARDHSNATAEMMQYIKDLGMDQLLLQLTNAAATERPANPRLLMARMLAEMCTPSELAEAGIQKVLQTEKPVISEIAIGQLKQSEKPAEDTADPAANAAAYAREYLSELAISLVMKV